MMHLQRGDTVRHKPPVPYPAQGDGLVRDIDHADYVTKDGFARLTVDFGRFKFNCYENEVYRIDPAT